MGRFFERYMSKVQRIARRRVDGRVQRRMNLSDLVQNSLQAASDRIEGEDLGTRKKIHAWFEKVTKREVDRERSHARAQRRDPYREVALEAPAEGGEIRLDPQAGGPSPSGMAMNAEQAAMIDEVLETLSPDHREVITQRTIRGLSWAEVAEGIDRSVSAAKSLHERALLIFRERLAARMDR